MHAHGTQHTEYWTSVREPILPQQMPRWDRTGVDPNGPAGVHAHLSRALWWPPAGGSVLCKYSDPSFHFLLPGRVNPENRPELNLQISGTLAVTLAGVPFGMRMPSPAESGGHGWKHRPLGALGSDKWHCFCTHYWLLNPDVLLGDSTIQRSLTL